MPIDHRLQTALWIGLVVAMLWLVALLGPILTPFLLAGILAYICNPLVDRLQGLRLPRTLAVLTVLLLLLAVLVGLVGVLIPLLTREAGVVAARLPDALTKANEQIGPWLQTTFGLDLKFDPASLRSLAVENMDSLQGVAQKLFQSLRIGGVAAVGLLVNLTLTPVVMFYLLLDWHPLLARVDNAIPRAWHAKTVSMAREVDAVLSQFLRGQILVMLTLALYYSLALWIVGLPSAIAIGLFTGLLVFVPYIGFATGFILALLVAALQFDGLGPIIAVLAVYGLGQLLESFLLTPYLVGERIGLHPLAVIFALMAFGQLFGFFGVLLALPASAALVVALRELRTLYLASRAYRGPDA
ncbi:MAG: AI-2E family transporter [Gammaproteobacteria bacterium]|nr:AI-2E family transporter [Gammaproteobacteria bacterium]MBU1416797.1 AI-2E family transporter [Gammaproteobacteria bacterium]